MVCDRTCIFFIGLILLELATVNADIIFREEPVDSVVVDGLPLSFHCLVEDSENRGRVVVQWRRNNSPLQINSDSRLNQFPNGTLYITATQTGDEGRYSCLASVIGTTGIVEQRTSVEAELKFAFIDPIFYSPQNITVVDQQPTPAYFQCISGDSLPVATISWEKDGKLLEEANQYATMFGGSDSMKRSGTLQIDNVRTRHAGRYRCITTNELLPGQSKYSDYALLTVTPNPGQPYLNKAPTSQIVPLFDPAAFDCEVLGDPEPQTTWLKDGEELTSRGDGRITIYQNGTLYFRRVEEQDEGAYICNGSSSLGSVASEEVTLLTAYIDWNFLQEPADLTVVEENVATLFCRPPNSKPAAEVTWYKDNVLLSPRSGVAILDVGDLYFSAVNVADEGEYRCVATNEYVPRSVTSQTALLEVKVGALITSPPTNKEVTLGDDLSLTCSASGDPTPTLRWLKDNVEIQAGGRITIGDSGGLLHVIDMTSLDRGTYTCMAGNNYGTDQESVYINVLVPPRITLFPRDLSVGIGSSVLMSCVVIAEPPPTIQWFKDGTELTFDPTNEHFQKTMAGLYISGVGLSDNGHYSCKAHNKVGSVEANGTLTVETPPVFTQGPTNQTVSEGAVVYFQCFAEGVPNPTISWAFNGGSLPPQISLSKSHEVLTIPLASRDLVGIYTCRAENTQGLIRTDVYLRVQTAPVIDSISNLTINTGELVSVSCNALFGYPDVSYNWLKDGNILTSDGDHLQFPQPNELEIQLQGNDDQGWYTCVASNAIGTARQSFYISVIDIPMPPVILDVIALSESSILVTWTAGGDPDDVDTFEVQYKMSSDSWMVAESFIPSTLEIESLAIEGLTENREYHIRVLASNNLGSSQPSGFLVAYTPSVSGPSFPRNVRVIFFNSTTVELEWEIPEERSGPIAVYFIEITKLSLNGSSTDSQTIEIPGEGRYTIEYIIRDLRPNSVYYFQVCAATLFEEELQRGNCSHTVHQETATAEPDAAPENIQVSALSSTSISISWLPIPEFNHNGFLLGYIVQYKTIDSEEFREERVNGTENVITGLQPWTEYEVLVQGYNYIGPGPVSEHETVRTKPDVPTGSPKIMSNQTINETTLFLSWQEVAEGSRNGPIDGYTVVLRQEKSTDTTEYNVLAAQRNLTISGLQVSTLYELSVAAYNLHDGTILTGPAAPSVLISTGDGVPGKIGDLTVGSVGSSYVFLSWVAPSEDKGDILGYMLRYTAIEGNDLSRRTQREVTTGKNAAYGEVFTTQTEYNITDLTAGTNYSVIIVAKTTAGFGEEVAFFFSTAEVMKTTTPNFTIITPEEGELVNDDEKWQLLGLPFNSFIIFASAVGLAFVFFLFAIIFITAWCSRASGKKEIKRRQAPLLRNDQFVQITNHSSEGVDNYSRTESSSPTPSSTAAAPTSSQVLLDNNHIESRPRASSSPASAQLAVHNMPNHNQGNPYGTNPRPDTSRSARSLDASPDQLDDLYQKVNKSSRGPSRFQKDSLLAIAALLDQEESDNETRPPDSPPSVVIADQRTVL
ncbi:Down syndrome cell adhesion molecule-like [Holothuria leucospilota]|uniref:Down syndrome cell adhesion molecule-like n=1 Tax=Holothuria leucospilota TaxID=206669 RepID=A0A9Q1C593_HOLLE|nr:Down syndrome cell adhesion molecule-like [Holothuria leucospilota]